MLGVEVECVADDGAPVPDGERGEVVIRGPNIMKGYFRQPEATAEALRGGWFHTGDIGVIDADGYLAIVDRKKDMILRGGFNVYPREIEELLLTHPAVGQCAVVGIPDERLGEDVKAFVVARPGQAATEDEIVAWCRERMAVYKAPRYVEFTDGAADERDRQGAEARAARRPVVVSGRRGSTPCGFGRRGTALAPSDAIGSLKKRISGAAARKIASSVG